MPFVYLDTETTGLYSTDEIVEIAIVSDDESVLLNTLVKPSRKRTWPEAQRIHGISPKMVSNVPRLKDLEQQIHDAVAGNDVIIYNAAYDSRFLKSMLDYAASVQCCMLPFAKHYGEWSDWHGNYRWQRLSVAAEDVGFKWPGDAHRALADALACRAVWRFLQDKKGA